MTETQLELEGFQRAAPAPQDLCAVAVNMAARMSYGAHLLWQKETSGDAGPRWEDLPAEQRANMVGFVLTLATYPDLTPDDMHDMALERAPEQMPETTRMALPLCPPVYQVSMALNVAVARAVIDNLVSAHDMREYIRTLNDGTDEFMQEH